MADVSSWAGQALTALIAAGGGFLVAKRSGAATEKTAATNGETSLQVKAFEMVSNELKRVQERSDKIEENSREQYDALKLEVKGLNERVLTLEIEKANMQVEKANLLTEHSRKERAWEACEGGLNERIHDLTVENERMNKSNEQLRDNQGKFVEFIQTHIDTTYNETNFDILQIGDVEIDRRFKHNDRFRDSMDHVAGAATPKKADCP